MHKRPRIFSNIDRMVLLRFDYSVNVHTRSHAHNINILDLVARIPDGRAFLKKVLLIHGRHRRSYKKKVRGLWTPTHWPPTPTPISRDTEIEYDVLSSAHANIVSLIACDEWNSVNK